MGSKKLIDKKQTLKSYSITVRNIQSNVGTCYSYVIADGIIPETRQRYIIDSECTRYEFPCEHFIFEFSANRNKLFEQKGDTPK